MVQSIPSGKPLAILADVPSVRGACRSQTGTLHAYPNVSFIALIQFSMSIRHMYIKFVNMLPGTPVPITQPLNNGIIYPRAPLNTSK